MENGGISLEVEMTTAKPSITSDDLAALAEILYHSAGVFMARKKLLAYVAQNFPAYYADLRKLTEKYSPVRAEASAAIMMRDGQELWTDGVNCLTETEERRQMAHEVIDFMRQFRRQPAPER